MLQSAAQDAHQLGAEPLLAEIRALARQADLRLAVERPEGDGPSDLERLGLTPRETEVLQLLASGATNRQVATQLFISTKTASVHVSNILAKLGVATRGEAAAVAHRLRLFETDFGLMTAGSTGG